jgi:hypothetical protein
MAWTKVNFGKHSGKTLPQIAFADPDYLYWAIGDKLFAKGPLAAEAKDVARKAQRIRIQGCDPGEKKVRYYTHNPSGKLGMWRWSKLTEGLTMALAQPTTETFSICSTRRSWHRMIRLEDRSS